MSTLEKIQRVIDHGQFIQGPEVFQFERELSEYQQCKHTISCGNGTDALQIALMAIDARPGEEVIIPAFGYAAVAEICTLLKLKIVFCDVDINTYNIDVNQIAEKITDKTIAIIPMHLFGQCCDMEAILSIAKDRELYVIEDAAQSLGAEFIALNGHRYKSGTMGHIGCTSFFPSKNLSCYGDGGALFTDDDILSKRIRMICNHGQSEKYIHDIVGVNSRLDTIQAVVLSDNLKNLDSKVKERQKYVEKWADYDVFVAPYSTHTYHQFTIKQRLPDKRVYYPLPLHKQKAYFQDVSMPVSEWLSQNVCSL